jgi:crotonobetainyl-CoA:carnitine CoA-transferase CaiB-like acyl-CoA transferase
MIDVAQYDCMVAYNTLITGYTLSGLLPVELRKKYTLGRGVGGLYEAKDGGWIRIAAFGPRFMDLLNQHYGLEMVEREFIGERVKEMDRDEAVEHFVGLGLPCAPIFNVDETVADPHLAARGMFVEVEHPLAGTVKVPNFPIKFSETPGEIKSAAPLLGAHSKKLLMGILGMSEERFGELVRAGVTSQA